MTDEHHQSNDLHFYQTAEYPCSYFQNRIARSLIAAPLESIDTDHYNQLINYGFRRSGKHVYRPYCQNCNACLSIRVIAKDFIPNRSQKRTFKKWQHLKVQICELRFSAEHFELYQHYQKNRHANGETALDDTEQFSQFILESQVNSFLIEFRDETDKLLMVSLIDSTVQGLSAVYTFYETLGYSGLGTYSILWQIAIAKQLHMPFVYLGYWIENSEKMAYKANFSNTQIFLNKQWQNKV